MTITDNGPTQPEVDEISAERERLKSTFGIEQTPPDFLNEFDTRNEAYEAWIESKIAQ